MLGDTPLAFCTTCSPFFDIYHGDALRSVATGTTQLLPDTWIVLTWNEPNDESCWFSLYDYA